MARGFVIGPQEAAQRRTTPGGADGEHALQATRADPGEFRQTTDERRGRRQGAETICGGHETLKTSGESRRVHNPNWGSRSAAVLRAGMVLVPSNAEVCRARRRVIRPWVTMEDMFLNQQFVDNLFGARFLRRRLEGGRQFAVLPESQEETQAVQVASDTAVYRRFSSHTCSDEAQVPFESALVPLGRIYIPSLCRLSDFTIDSMPPIARGVTPRGPPRLRDRTGKVISRFDCSAMRLQTLLYMHEINGGSSEDTSAATTYASV